MKHKRIKNPPNKQKQSIQALKDTYKTIKLKQTNNIESKLKH